VSDGTDLRDDFLLDPSVTFLNQGSFGACPRAVFAGYNDAGDLERLKTALDELLT
jgi:hypothetical protein